MDSIWTQSVELPCFQTLEGDTKTDVLIIGGGMAGILCAYFLEKNGVDYILAEGKSICSGITRNTTAKITSQHGLIYNKLLKSIGIEKAKLYLEANQKAVQEYAELCKNIDCDFERKTAYVYSLDDRRRLEDEAKALEQIGLQTNIEETNELPMHTVGAIGFKDQAQFNPLKFIAHIASDLNIYENTFVKELKEDEAITDEGNIAFKKLIFATHFPIDNKHGMFFLKMYQHRSYVIALEDAPQVNGMYIDESIGGMSFRNYKNFLLIGGGSHKTGKEGGNWNELRNFARLYYPNMDERYCWAAQDCMTLDGIPYIGQYSRNMPQYFVATGFNKWGMTSSMAAAMILSSLIIGKESPYATVFNPSRNMMKPQLLVNGGAAIANLLTLSEKRCPHLGCALKWNKNEHSWDCPCHGSRFDGSGRVLDNPANGNLNP